MVWKPLKYSFMMCCSLVSCTTSILINFDLDKRQKLRFHTIAHFHLYYKSIYQGKNAKQWMNDLKVSLHYMFYLPSYLEYGGKKWEIWKAPSPGGNVGDGGKFWNLEEMLSFLYINTTDCGKICQLLWKFTFFSRLSWQNTQGVEIGPIHLCANTKQKANISTEDSSCIPRQFSPWRLLSSVDSYQLKMSQTFVMQYVASQLYLISLLTRHSNAH